MLKKPAAMICGAADTLATPNTMTDYTVSKVPTFFSVMDGVDHIAAARQGMGAIVSWLRWQLAGELERKADFTTGGVFTMGKFKSMSKGL